MAIVFAIVLVTNIVDDSHFTELQKSFESVYEDRLIAEIYIYKLSNHVNTKRTQADHNIFSDRSADDSIQLLIDKYEATRLTPNEKTHFNSLKKNISVLRLLEEDMQDVRGPLRNAQLKEINEQYEAITANLESLSEVQMHEGKRLIDNSNRIIAASHFTSRIEVIIVIIAGLFIQALILASRSARPKFDQNSHLN